MPKPRYQEQSEQMEFMARHVPTSIGAVNALMEALEAQADYQEALLKLEGAADD